MKLEQQVVIKRIPWNKGKHGYNMPLRGGGYYAVHKWLVKHYGKANHCENPTCENKSTMLVWAKKHDKDYEYKVENFIQLCQSCHMRQDRTIEWTKNNADAKRGKPHTEEHKKKISISMKGRYL